MAAAATAAPPYSPSVAPAPPMMNPVMNQMGAAQQGALSAGSQVQTLEAAVQALAQKTIEVVQIAQAVDQTIIPYLSVIANAGTEIQKRIEELKQREMGGSAPPAAAAAPPVEA